MSSGVDLVRIKTEPPAKPFTKTIFSRRSDGLLLCSALVVASVLSPAPLGKRIRAGLLDAAVLSVLSGAYFFIPLLATGLVLPMWGVLAAGIGYAVVPLAAFRATLGMRIFGVEILGRDGQSANPADLLFRELVGRGLLPGAFLFTLAMSFVGSLLRWTAFVMPTGLGSLMALASLLAMAVVFPGHFLPLFRADRRSLADLLSRTQVVDPRPEPEPDDEEDRAFRSQQRRSRIVRVVVFELLLASGVVALPWLLGRRSGSTEEYADRITRQRLEKELERAPSNEVTAQQLAEAYRKAGRPEDAEKVLARQLDAALAELTCEAPKALAFGDRMNREERYDAAIRWVRRYEEKCGPLPRLLWVSMYAHQQRREWSEAVAVATRLIENEPDDSDFWWWRGEAYANLGRIEQAAADYQQSMAQHPNAFAAGRYAELAETRLQRPCDGAFALWFWMEEEEGNGEETGPRAQRERDRLYRAGGCERFLGKGRIAIKRASEDAVGTAKLVINGHALIADATDLAAYTLLSSELAAKVGVDTSASEKVNVWLGGEWLEARRVSLPEVQLEKARAVDLAAAVVDKLPPGTDAVLGVNLAWRFRVRQEDSGLTLEERPRGTRPSAAAR
jgi:uncharacterized RDD family membrane protein YckC